MKKLWKKTMFRRYLSFILVLCIGTSLYIPLAAEEVQEEDVNVSMEGAPRLNYTAITEDGIVASNEQLQELMEEYFSLREETMTGNMKDTVVARKVSDLAKSEEVLQKEAARSEGVDNLATYHGVHVQEWTNHFYIENEEVLPITAATGKEGLKLNVYEWNWVVYDDGKGGPKDEMGFSTIHEMTLEKDAGGRYRITKDAYDESELLGKRDKTYAEIVQESASKVASIEQDSLQMVAGTMALPSGHTIPDGSTVGSNKKGSVSYNVQAARRYADRYVGHPGSSRYGYNTKYVAFTNADCANYVSQCLLAGGMHIDYGPNNAPNIHNNTDQWWYNPSENDWITESDKYETCPQAWREVSAFETYWTKQGYKKVTATASSIFPGNPVYDSTHLMICVGYSASGVPILNGHTTDWYHVPYTACKNSINTIQLVSNPSMPSPQMATSITLSTQQQSKTLELQKNVPLFFKFNNSGGTKRYLSLRSSTYTPNGTVDVEVYLYKKAVGTSQLVEVAYDDDSGDYTNFYLSNISLDAGEYFIEIRGATSSAAGTFIFSYWVS